MHRRLPRALQDGVTDRDDGRARDPRGAGRAGRPPPRGRDLQAEGVRRPLLDAMGIGPYFSVVAGPDLGAPAEDKTETLGRALHELGPTRAVMVGDRSFDIVAAHAHGLPAIGVTWGIGKHKELHDAGAERIIGHARRPRGDRSRPVRRLMSASCSPTSAFTTSRCGCTSAQPSSASAHLRARGRLPARAPARPEVHALRAPPEPRGHPQAGLAGAAADPDHHRRLPGRGADISMDEPWIGITFVIAIVLGGLQGAYFVPTDKKLAAMAEKELADGRRRFGGLPAPGAARRHDGRPRRLPDHPRRVADGDEAGGLAPPTT